MCLLVLAIKTLLSSIFDLPRENKSDEVFTQIGRRKIRKFGNFVGCEQNPSSILRGGKPFLRPKIPIFFVS